MTKAIALPIWVLLIQLLYRNNSREPESTLVCDDYFINRAKKSYAIILLLLPFFFAAFRVEFADTESYIHTFNSISDYSSLTAFANSYGKCELFYGIEYYFYKYISQDAQFFLFLVALLQSVLFIRTIRRFSEDFGMSAYVFVCNAMVFNWMCNGIRQFIVVAILFSLVDTVLKGKWYIFLPIVVFLTGLSPFYKMLGIEGRPIWFLCGIHESAIIVLPIYFIVRGKALTKKVWILLGVLLVLTALGLLDSFLDTSTENTMYANEMDHVHADDGTNPIRVLVSSIPVLLVLYKRRNIINSELPSIISLSINMSFVSSTLYIASIFTSGIFVGRLPAYCEVYNLILLPWLIINFHPHDRRIISPLLYALYLVYFIYQVLIVWGDNQFIIQIFGTQF
ncbi:MAG: EpsG family protein [Eubacterium sp.]|nr:EpsG family protein [Eubacterium sp.]